MFVYSSRVDAPHHSGIELCHRHSVREGWAGAIRDALEAVEFEVAFINIERCTGLAQQFLEAQLPTELRSGEGCEVELLKSVFYRNKGAYLVGRIVKGEQQVPLVLPILHEEDKGCGWIR